MMLLYFAILVLVVCNGVAHAASCMDVKIAKKKCMTYEYKAMSNNMSWESDKDERMEIECDIHKMSYGCFYNIVAKYYKISHCAELKEIAFGLKRAEHSECSGSKGKLLALKQAEYCECGSNTVVFTVWLLLVNSIVIALFN